MHVLKMNVRGEDVIVLLLEIKILPFTHTGVNFL